MFPDEEERKAQRPRYDERLDYEIGTIINMGFSGYFLIVADFIRWAKNNGVPVGPGRGSGAGSLVAYSLLITNLDPLAYNLIFERFLNPERVSMPDFDEMCIRDSVIAGQYFMNARGKTTQQDCSNERANQKRKNFLKDNEERHRKTHFMA